MGKHKIVQLKGLVRCCGRFQFSAILNMILSTLLARPLFTPPTLAGTIQGNHKYCCAAERIGVMESLRGIYEVDLNKKKINHVWAILSDFPACKATQRRLTRKSLQEICFVLPSYLKREQGLVGCNTWKQNERKCSNICTQSKRFS